MNFTQTQITSILDDYAKKENGYQSLLKIVFETIMRAERK